MGQNKQVTLNSLYIPLIIAIPANILFLIRLQFGLPYRWGWVAFVVFTLFLVITGGISVRKKETKSRILGLVYLISAILFICLALLLS
ncbi:hypothetical protein [Sediminibacillus halophilus]|uniref:Uncharacterized protein n=1 Tax=Sediminibacillus halophilus TaxID=482461 RepID=A0A1G9R398_9BACI|nr:hypothetical protein [Sediminibacillus halophilus]SDM17337.1 hypothetical protein SAMN05216244_1779 [Sediminibacillus halophilus]